jgi:hypothetical protein
MFSPALWRRIAKTRQSVLQKLARIIHPTARRSEWSTHTAGSRVVSEIPAGRAPSPISNDKLCCHSRAPDLARCSARRQGVAAGPEDRALSHRGAWTPPWPRSSLPRRPLTERAANAKMPVAQILHQSIMGSCYVGFGGLSLHCRCGQMRWHRHVQPGPSEVHLCPALPSEPPPHPHVGWSALHRQLGNSAAVPAALYEGLVDINGLV